MQNLGGQTKSIMVFSELAYRDLTGLKNDEKISRKNGNAQYQATFFRHSAVLSLPAVLLRKVSKDNRDCDFYLVTNESRLP